jgi:putative transposase
VIWQMLNHFNQQHGKGWQIPSLRTMYEQIDRKIPMPAQVLYRQGQAAYNARCAPYIMTDFDSIQPGQIWTGDHHEFDCKIRHRGEWVRPWLTCWQDMRSRTIVGHHISLSPNQTTIIRSRCRRTRRRS